MKTAILVFLFLCFSVFLVSGCATVSANKDKPLSDSANLLEPQVMLKFVDVPVPVGFKFLPQESYSFESTGVRVGLLKYQGKADPDSVVNFYKEQMGIYEWNLVNAIEYGERLLNFERENETCIISLSPKGSSVTVIISLGPKAQTLPKKSEKPVK